MLKKFHQGTQKFPIFNHPFLPNGCKFLDEIDTVNLVYLYVIAKKNSNFFSKILIFQNKFLRTLKGQPHQEVMPCTTIYPDNKSIRYLNVSLFLIGYRNPNFFIIYGFLGKPWGPQSKNCLRFLGRLLHCFKMKRVPPVSDQIFKILERLSIRAN